MQFNLGLIIVVLLIISGLFISCIPGRKIEEKFEKEIDFIDHGSIILENTNGKIQVNTWEKSAVRIVAHQTVRARTYRAAEAFLKEVKINIRQFSNEIRISSDYPRQESFSGFFSLFTGSGHAFVSIAFELTVPQNSKLELETTNGAIEINNINEKISAKSTNGSLKFNDIQGNLDAGTTNGSIEASFSAIGADCEIEMHTTNGRIEITLPDSTSAELSARTTNGKISTDFPVQVQGGFAGNKIEGTIAGGDGRINLHTTNGSISIRKR